MKHRLFITIALCSLLTTTTQAARPTDDQKETKNSFWHDVRLTARLGLNIGGTAPVGLPATIRQLNSYEPQSNPAYAILAEKSLTTQWGVSTGLYYENKGMRTDAEVKNYQITMIHGGERLEGVFTGSVTTEVDEWMLTLPLQAVWHPGERWSVHGGPYVSYLVQRRFDGEAHSGYLRVDNPTGAKVELGSEPGTTGTYDFSKDMRHWQWGLMVGADCRLWKRVGFFAELKWGLTGVHRADFHTIDQTLYPIFGSAGVTYRLR